MLSTIDYQVFILITVPAPVPVPVRDFVLVILSFSIFSVWASILFSFTLLLLRFTVLLFLVCHDFQNGI